MPMSKETLKLLRDFAANAAKEAGDDLPVDELLRGFRTGRIPSSGAEEDAGWRGITGEDLGHFEECVGALAAEPELEHLTRKDIDRELWELLLDYSSDWQRYQVAGIREDRLRVFLASIVKPHDPFEVMFEVEGLSIKDESIAVAGVVFSHVDEQTAAEWGISDQDGYMRISNELVGKAVGRVKVKAGSSSKALEKAREELDMALNVLRVCIASGSIRVWDEQLLQRRGQLHVVRALRSTPTSLPGWQRTFSMIELKLGGPLHRETVDLVKRLDPVLQGKLPTRMNERLIRALQWIGMSVTREHYDHKVVDLCTALECLLTGRDDTKKGEAISLRTMLLSFTLDRTFAHPSEIYRWYDLRSEVIHGSAIGNCTATDYLRLRRVVLGTLLNAMDLALENDTVISVFHLISVVEECDTLARAIQCLQEGTDRGSEAIRKYAEGRLSTLYPDRPSANP